VAVIASGEKIKEAEPRAPTMWRQRDGGANRRRWLDFEAWCDTRQMSVEIWVRCSAEG